MNDDVRWLLSCEVFGGHPFKMFKEHDMDRCAAIAKAATEQNDFVEVLLSRIEDERVALEDRKALLDEAGEAIYLEIFRLSVWDGRRRFATLLEAFVSDAMGALKRFHAEPKRSPKHHREHYARIEDLAVQLSVALDADPELHTWSSDDGPEFLRGLASLAKVIAANPPLARPHARHADRTYVAKAICHSMRRYIGSHRHAASASLVNAMFPAIDPVDAGYMQSLSRTLPQDD